MCGASGEGVGGIGEACRGGSKSRYIGVCIGVTVERVGVLGSKRRSIFSRLPVMAGNLNR